MIQFGDQAMIPDLKRIWKECFGDSDAYIDFFFSNRYQANQALVWMEAGQAVAMLHLLPAELLTAGRAVPVRYIYAVATLPAWQGRQISSRLLAYAHEYLEKRQELSMLVPASASLYDFYGRRGYQKGFVCSVQEFSEVPLPEAGITFESIDAEHYTRLRNQYFHGEGFVRWDREAVDYALRETHFGGGFSGYLKKREPDGSGFDGAVLGYVRGQRLIIKELACPPAARPSLITYLMDQMGAEQAEVRLPYDGSGVKADLGMVRGISLGQGYLGLALD